MEQRSPEEGGRGLLPAMPRNGLSLPSSVVESTGNYSTQPGVGLRTNEPTACDFAPPLVHSADNYMHQIDEGPSLQQNGNLPPQDNTATREFTARSPAPESIAAPESTEALIRKFNGYKLETDFYDSYVVHRTYEWKELSSRSWEISKWVKKERIGSGAFGTVWLQEKEEGGQLRAVKQLPRGSSREEVYSQELLALVKLKGYNYLFVDFLGWYENLDYTFLAMEYIEYGDLSRYMKGPGTIMETKEIIRQILEGLEILHAKGICHRDLKPQNILMASLDPIWVKIADFGVSKRTKGTYLRTLIGTQGYLAPEIIGLIPRKPKEKGFILHALDIWSLGSIAHELLTSETPFLSSDEDFESETGIQADLLPEREIDITSLHEYCSGTIEFPTDVLKRSRVDEEGIAFVKSLLVASPKGRPTAAHVLQNPWLVGYISGYVENLRNEFSQLGVDLGPRDKKNTFMRQIDKEDIIRFLPSSKKGASSLLLEAAAKGCNLVISKIFESPTSGLGSIDNLTRGELFRLAIEARQLDTIKLLLKKESDIGACIGDKTVIQWVFERGDVNSASLLLENTKDTKIKDSCKELFRLAIKNKHVEMMKLFLSHKVEIDGLEEAARVGRVYLVRFLLDSKTSINSKVLEGAFLAAVKGGHIDVVKLLLDNKANTNPIPSGGGAALQAAAGNRYIDITNPLLDSKVNTNARLSPGLLWTALGAAVEGGYLDILQLLLDNNKVNINSKNPTDHKTLLQVAVEGGHIERVKFLLENNADTTSSTLLQLAIEGRHIEILRLLLKNNAHVKFIAPRSFQTPFELAIKYGDTEIVKLLLENKADVNAVGWQSGSTPLKQAIKYGHTEIVKLLLQNYASVNEFRWLDRTPLQQAIKYGHTESVELLLENNVNVNALGWLTRTPLQLAIQYEHTEIVKLLLQKNADVNDIGESDQTPLQEAIWRRHTEIVKLLLQKNVNVNAIGESCQTPLQVAILRRHTEIVKLLLQNNANVNALGRSGQTPLQVAAEGGHTEIVKLLLQNNANVDAVGRSGQTPLQLAIEGRHPDIVKLLQKKAETKHKESWYSSFTRGIFT